jgi:hypothetical protein
MLEVSISSPTFGHPHEDLNPLNVRQNLGTEGASEYHWYFGENFTSQEQKGWCFMGPFKEAQVWNNADHCASSVLLFCVPAGLRSFDLREAFRGLCLATLNNVRFAHLPLHNSENFQVDSQEAYY